MVHGDSTRERAKEVAGKVSREVYRSVDRGRGLLQLLLGNHAMATLRGSSIALFRVSCPMGDDAPASQFQ